MNDTQSSTDGPTSQEELAAQFERLRKDVQELSALLKKVGAEKVEGVRDEAEARAAEFAELGRRQAESALKSAATLEAFVAEHVRDKPMQSLAIAGAIGFIFGLMSRRG